MDSRKQMTFYVSFWEAINALPKRDQLPVMRATVAYGLFGQHEEKLTVSQNAFFSLIKPNLDTSRKKASSGKHGGSKVKANGKQDESKPQANRKQTASEKENEGEKENEEENEEEVEKEIENECYLSATADKAVVPSFDVFWNSYPNQVAREQALQTWDSLSVTGEMFTSILCGLTRWKRSIEWEKNGGQYIPRPAKWLSEKRWLEHPTEVIPKGASGHLGQAELDAIQKLLQEG